MTNKKTTRKALLLSALSLLLCFSMLIGTTYAWFTDSVTSANNKIVAGNLKIDLELLEADDTTWTSVKESKKAIFNYDKWEPGFTDVKILRVSNKGTLALKWVAKFVSDFELSPLAEVIDVYVNTTVNAYPDDRADLSAWTHVGTVKDFVNTIGATTKGTLEAGASANLGIALKMQETAGNEFQGMDLGGEFDIQILATQYTFEEDSFNDQYDMGAAIYVKNTAEAQAALDNAKKGDVIVLASGNYGTLVFGQNADSKVVDISDLGGDAHGNEHYSRYEDITILGTTGAIVDQIMFKTGWINGSEGASYVDIKNLTVKGVTFSGAKDAVKFNDGGSYLGVDGFSLIDCKMNDDGNSRFVYQPHAGYKTLNDKTTGMYVMTTGVKNLTITDCRINGAYQVLEGRPMENITITNNAFNGIKARDILLSGNATVPYSGTITITGNTSVAGEERFVRMTAAENATVLIKNNTVNTYLSKELDYIKVTDSNSVVINDEPNVTIENNTLASIGVKDAEGLKNAIIYGKSKIEFVNDITVDQWIMFSEDYHIGSGQIITLTMDGLTIDGNGHTLTVKGIESAGNGNSLFQGATNLNIYNLTIKNECGAGGIGLDSGVIKNVTFIGGGNIIYPGTGEILVENCTFNSNGDALYFEHECDNLTVTGCTFNLPATQNVILLRGDVKFTNNTVNSGRTVNVVSGSPVVTGNNFNNVRLKVYAAATATISNNVIGNLEFEAATNATYASTFTNNTLSAAAQAVLNAATKTN
ncbi:MAG: SipW-dependent-type signal peptide-containing protein [Clostridia bacterium]|nr:SipW-dependent-type signal peptide-containing protein [Clostridia bacterium]